ncbi:unnamed protein product [Closterium sp. NIES-54]
MPALSLSTYRARLSRALKPAAPAVASPLLFRPVPSPLLSRRPCRRIAPAVPSPLLSRPIAPAATSPLLSHPVPSPLLSRRPCCPVPSPLPSCRPCCPVASPPAVPSVPPRRAVRPVLSRLRHASRPVPSHAPHAPCPSVAPRAPCPSVAPRAPCPSIAPPLRPARPSRPRCALPVRHTPCALPVRTCRARPCQSRPVPSRRTVFERTADLITHLRSLDSSYRAACTDAQLALLPPPMAITIYFIATSLPVCLASVLAVTTSSRSRVRSGRRGGQGAGGGGGDGGGGVASGGGGRVGAGGAPRAAAGDSRAAAGGATAAAAAPPQAAATAAAAAAVVAAGFGAGVRTAPAPDWLPLLQTYGSALWGMSASQLVDLLGTSHAMYAVVDSSAFDSVYSSVVSLGASLAEVHVASVGTCVDTSPGAAPKEALLSFTLDSGASHCFFRDRKTLTPLPTPVSVAPADPTTGPVTTRYTTTLPCLAVLSGYLTGFHIPSFSRNLVGVRPLVSQHVGVWIEPSGETAVPASHQVAASPQVALSGQMGHPSISRLRAMSSQHLVLGLPRVLPTLLPSLAPPCGPCVEGRLRTTPHSSSLCPTTEPFETLHLDVWGPASRPGPERESFFLVVVDDYSRCTTVFLLAKKSDVTSTLIRWLLTTADTRGRRVSCLHSDRGGEFRSGVLAGFCCKKGIRQSWTLPESPQRNGVAELRIGLVMETARTSMTHVCAPHFLWPYAVRYTAHQLNLWPRVSRLEVSLTSLSTRSPGAASRFRVWGCLALVRDTSADKILPRVVPCVFLGFPEDSSDYTFYHPPLHRFFDSRDVRFDESVPYYVSLPPLGPAPSSVSHVTPPPSVAPQVQPPSSQSSSQPTADPARAGFRGEDPGGAISRGAGVGAESVLMQGPSSGAGVSGAVPGGATTGGAPSGGPGEPGTYPVTSSGAGSGGAAGVGARGERVGAAAAGATAAGGAAAVATAAAAGAAAAAVAAAAAAAAARGAAAAATTGAAAAATSSSCLWSSDPQSPLSFSSLPPFSSRLCPPRLSPSVLPSPLELALTASLSIPVTDYYRTYRPVLSRVLASLVTDPRASLSSVSDLTATVTEFASTHCLDYATSLVAAPPTSPLAVGGESALGCDALEERQFDPEFLAATSPHLCAMLLAPEGDPDALDIPTPRTYAEAVSGPWASQWRAVMDSDMASYRSTAAQREYELHSLDFSTTFLQGSLHEEVWLRRPSVFSGTFPPVTQWRLRRPVYGLRQDPCEWHDTLRSTLSDLGFQPSSADPSLFVRRGSTPFFVLVYVDDVVFATTDRVALADVKRELQKRHTCTDLGELRHYLSLQITRDRAARTITLSQSHMVQQVLQRFKLQHSTVHRTPLAVDHRLTGPFLDESFEPSGPYIELVGCLMYLMTCTRPNLAFPLSILARFVAPRRHRPVHWTTAVRVAKYLATTSRVGLVLGGRQDVVLTGHSDSSYADDAETHRSIQGYCFSLGSRAVSWRSTRSSSVSTSTARAEIYGGAMAVQELRWLTFLLTDLGERPSSAPTFFTGNKAMILLCREPRLESRVKHGLGRGFSSVPKTTCVAVSSSMLDRPSSGGASRFASAMAARPRPAIALVEAVGVWQSLQMPSGSGSWSATSCGRPSHPPFCSLPFRQPSRNSHSMGGGGGAPGGYPNVWALTGGWYCDPKYWRRNTAFALAGIFAVCVPIALTSARLEQRPIAPSRAIPSQMWCSNFPTESNQASE